MTTKIDYSELWNSMECDWQDKLTWFYLQKHQRPGDKALCRFIEGVERELNQWSKTTPTPVN